MLFALLVSVFSTALSSIDVPAADAVVPGTNGRIVFESTRGGSSDIWVMNPDGSNQRNLTNHHAQDITPSWSPDGTKIAWASNRRGGRAYDIHIMNADGTNVVNLTAGLTGGFSDRWPSFSPDGRKIVFMSALNGGGNFEIYTMNVNGTDARRLTFTANIEECCADWSPDGSKIVFQTRRDGNFEIYTMNPDGSNQRNLTNHPAYDGTPRWSPDGRKITWRSTRFRNEIWTMNADGSNPTRVSFTPSLVRRPAISPDGKRIAFSLGQVGDSQIAVMNIDGTGMVTLTNSRGENNGPQWATHTGAPLPEPPLPSEPPTSEPPPSTPPPSGAGFLTLSFGRTQWVTADSTCTPMQGAVPLDQVAAAMRQRGATGVGAVILGHTRESQRTCNTGFPVVQSSWADINRLRDQFGWTFVSAGTNYRDMTQLTRQQQIDQSCGSLPAFVQRGHHRAWGMYAYPNDKSTHDIQANVVATCFAFGRKYGEGTNPRQQAGWPWFASTYSVVGGRCNNPALPCFTTGSWLRYDSPHKLAELMRPGSGQWNVVQAYRFVTGANTNPNSRWRWDCSSPDWRNHWVSVVELYCLNDFLAAVDQIPAGTVVTDPATVAQAWGRMGSSTPPPPPPPPPPSGTDTVPPSATVATPTEGQTVGRPVTFSGQASDDVGVQSVTLGIRNRATGLWWRSDGTWGAWEGHSATLGSPRAASTSWSFVWHPPPGPGGYGVAVIARDTSGNQQPLPRPWVNFQVSG